jgi:hypothetical protein
MPVSYTECINNFLEYDWMIILFELNTVNVADTTQLYHINDRKVYEMLI